MSNPRPDAGVVFPDARVAGIADVTRIDSHGGAEPILGKPLRHVLSVAGSHAVTEYGAVPLPFGGGLSQLGDKPEERSAQYGLIGQRARDELLDAATFGKRAVDRCEISGRVARAILADFGNRRGAVGPVRGKCLTGGEAG